MKQWNFVHEFTGQEFSMLIVGLDPLHGNINESKCVLARAKQDYKRAHEHLLQEVSGYCNEDDRPETNDPELENFQNYPPDALVSVKMHRGAILYYNHTIETPFSDWLESSDSDFENQTFSRREVSSWLELIGQVSVFEFWPKGSQKVQAARDTPDESTTSPDTAQESNTRLVIESQADAQAWIVKARVRAAEIIKSQSAKDLYPSQVDLGDQIAREFRVAGIVGVDGKPLSGSTIKRHALKGVSSAQGKQISTTIPRGK